jgi:hypothetical protein
MARKSSMKNREKLKKYLLQKEKEKLKLEESSTFVPSTEKDSKTP